MNSYMLIRRLRGPAILLLMGILALLHELEVIQHPWRLFWPLLFILLGVLMLAERAAYSSADYPMFPWMPWHNMPPGPPPSTPQQNAWSAASSAADPVTALAPSPAHDFQQRDQGGQS